jgi:hypothetical protein
VPEGIWRRLFFKNGKMGRNGAGEKRITEWVPKNWSFIFILFLAILGIYYQSLYYPFSNLDDPFYIHGNPYIRDLTLKGLWNIFSKPFSKCRSSIFPAEKDFFQSLGFFFCCSFIRPSSGQC